MSDKEFPSEAEKTVYERDKTAKEPVAPDEAPKVAKPKPKLRKAFVPKKVKLDKPMERRTRHILVTSVEAANMFRDTLLEFQKELADQSSDDPEKEYQDWQKVENLFSRLAKKYSTCPSKALGGSLDWVYAGLTSSESSDALNPQLVDAIMKAPKDTIPEPVKTPLGYHLLIICDTQIHIPRTKAKASPSAPQAPGIPGVPQ